MGVSAVGQDGVERDEAVRWGTVMSRSWIEARRTVEGVSSRLGRMGWIGEGDDWTGGGHDGFSVSCWTTRTRSRHTGALGADMVNTWSEYRVVDISFGDWNRSNCGAASLFGLGWAGNRSGMGFVLQKQLTMGTGKSNRY